VRTLFTTLHAGSIQPRLTKFCRMRERRSRKPRKSYWGVQLPAGSEYLTKHAARVSYWAGISRAYPQSLGTRTSIWHRRQRDPLFRHSRTIWTYCPLCDLGDYDERIALRKHFLQPQIRRRKLDFMCTISRGGCAYRLSNAGPPSQISRCRTFWLTPSQLIKNRVDP